MRPLVVVAAGLAGVATAVVPALAAQHQVTAGSFYFAPQTITVSPGDTVAWTSASPGAHTVHFEGEPGGHPIDADGYSRPFPEAGRFAYYCDNHPSMTGVVDVKSPATTGTTTTTGTSTSTTHTETATQTQTQTETQTQVTPETVALAPSYTVRATRRTFCTRRSPRCRRPGVVVEVTASEAATLAGALARRPLRGPGSRRRYGTVRLRAVAGARRIRFTRTREGRTLAPGRYTLAIDGLPRVHFRVTRR